MFHFWIAVHVLQLNPRVEHVLITVNSRLFGGSLTVLRINRGKNIIQKTILLSDKLMLRRLRSDIRSNESAAKKQENINRLF
jgi:hypothetical protein